MSRTSQRIRRPFPHTGAALGLLFAPPYKSVGRTTEHSGYLFEYQPSHLAANKWGFVQQHRLVAEHVLGFALLRDERVHHEDRQKTNNSQSNLWVFPDQSAHLRHHKRQEAHRYNEALISRLRVLAADSRMSYIEAGAALGVCAATVQTMVRMYQIPWKELTAQMVREALQDTTTELAALSLGVNHQTLRNNFPALLSKRVSPGSLEPHRDMIRSLATRERGGALGQRFGVCAATVKAAIRRWSAQEPDAWSDVIAFQRSRLGISWSRGRTA